MSVVVGILLFGAFYLAFRTGMRMGERASRGIAPEPLRPIKAIKDIKVKKEEEKKAKNIEEGIENIFSYTGGK